MKTAIAILMLAIFGASISAEENNPSKSIQIPCATWFHGFVHISDAVVVGKITDVIEAVSHIDSSSKLYKYSLAVSAVGGACPELKGVSEIRSENHHTVKVGEWVVMLVYYYEKKPDLATGGRPLDVVSGIDDPLAKLFIAKGAKYMSYNDADMRLLKQRMPAEYEHIRSLREYSAKQKAESEQFADPNGP